MRIKKIFTGLFLSTLIVTNAGAFRDVPSRAKVYKPLQSFIEMGVVQDGSFFRPTVDVPMQMFLEVLLKESGIDFLTTSVSEDEIFPENISEKSIHFPLVKTAISENIISPKKRFDPLAPISKLEALKTIVAIKKIIPPRRISPTFKKQYGNLLSPNILRSIDGRYLEAGVASNILTKQDLLTIDENLSRQDLIFWLHRYRNGEGNRSKIAKDNPFIKSKKLTIKIDGKEVGPPSTRLKKAARDGYQFPEEFLFEKIYQDILSKYRFSDELTEQKKSELIQAAIQGMVQNLEDKHSNYIMPERSRDYLDSLKGDFEGIGAYVEMVDGNFTITAPISGSPAEKAGILPKDVVTHVNGKPVSGNSIRETIALIKGPAGTDVELTISRKSQEKIISVTRAKVVIPAVEFKMVQSIPVITLKKFDDKVFSEFESIVREHVLGKNRKGLILDFRNNSGGLLDQATVLAEMFSKKGEDLVQIDYKDIKNIVRSQKDGVLADQKNIIILQNAGSASASEVFISFLKSVGRATVFGTPSYGKGTVQQLLKYPNNGVLKITIARWLDPKGNWIHEKGIQPDKVFEERTPEQIQSNADPVLDSAVREILNR